MSSVNVTDTRRLDSLLKSLSELEQLSQSPEEVRRARRYVAVWPNGKLRLEQFMLVSQTRNEFPLKTHAVVVYTLAVNLLVSPEGALQYELIDQLKDAGYTFEEGRVQPDHTATSSISGRGFTIRFHHSTYEE